MTNELEALKQALEHLESMRRVWPEIDTLEALRSYIARLQH